MKENISRREFFKRIFTASGALFIATTPLSIFAQETNPTNSTNSTSNLLSLKRQARELFYQKKYDQAANLYRQIIEQEPKVVSNYDGLRKVLVAQNRNLEAAELYKQALQINNDKPAFYDRMARTMNALCLGNQKDERAFCLKYGEIFLFESSIILYTQAIALNPNKKYLYEGMLDTVRCLEKLNKPLRHNNKIELSFAPQIIETIETTTVAYISDWARTRDSRKVTFAPEQAPETVQKIKNKPRRQLYTTEEIELRKKHIDEQVRTIRSNELKHLISSKANKNIITQKALTIAKDSPEETDTLKRLRRYYKKNEDYENLMKLYEQLYAQKKDFWTAVSLANAKCMYGWKNNVSVEINRARQLYRDACPNPARLNSKEASAYYLGLMQCYIAQRNYGQSRKLLVEIFGNSGNNGNNGNGNNGNGNNGNGNNGNGNNSNNFNNIKEGIELTILLAYAQSFSYEKQWKQGLKILDALLSATSDGKIDESEEINNCIKNRKGKELHPQEQIKIHVAIAKIQKGQGDRAGLNKTKANILQLDPQNGFARKLG